MTNQTNATVFALNAYEHNGGDGSWTLNNP
jgi:hypothetical protein